MNTNVLQRRGVTTIEIMNHQLTEVYKKGEQVKLFFLYYFVYRMVYFILMNVVIYRLSKASSKLEVFIKKPSGFICEIEYIQENSQSIIQFYTKVIKELSAYKEPQNVKLYRILFKIRDQVYAVNNINIKLIVGEEAPGMVSRFHDLFKAILASPLFIKIQLIWFLLSGLFLFSLGLCDLFGRTVLNIKAPGILFGMLLWLPLIAYVVKIERWVKGR